jgi:hypothetical protein
MEYMTAQMAMTRRIKLRVGDQFRFGAGEKDCGEVVCMVVSMVGGAPFPFKMSCKSTFGWTPLSGPYRGRVYAFGVPADNPPTVWIVDLAEEDTE